MVNFNLTDEQKQLVAMLNKFARDEIRPAAAEYDKKANPKECIPHSLIEKALSLKLGSIVIPEEYGGCGYKDIDIALIAEELAWGDAGFALTILCNIHLGHVLTKFGTEEQKKKWLTAIASENVLAAEAFTEPSCGNDVIAPDPRLGIQTTAVLDGDSYVLNGTKCFVTNGGLAKYYLVCARTDKTKGALDGGLSLFIVPSDTPGVSVGKIEDKMGMRLSQQSELIFDNCRVPKENILGQEGMGATIGFDLVATTCMMVASICIGIARAAFEYAYGYSKQRIQGGSEIIKHQAISHKLADIAMSIEAARALNWKSAWFNDNVMPNNILASMCKVVASDMVNKSTSEAMQILGGYGYMKEFPLEKLVRDAKLMPIGDICNEVHRSFIIELMQNMEKNMQV